MEGVGAFEEEGNVRDGHNAVYYCCNQWQVFTGVYSTCHKVRRKVFQEIMQPMHFLGGEYLNKLNTLITGGVENGMNRIIGVEERGVTISLMSVYFV